MAKRKASGTWTTSASAKKRHRGAAYKSTPRKGYSSVAAAVQGEMKYFDAEHTGATISTVTTTWVAGTMFDPTATINIGDAAVATPLALFVPRVSAALNGRIGRKVKVHKIRVKGLLNQPVQAAAGADNATEVRVLLVQDCQTNGTQMTSAQLLQDAGGPQSTIVTCQNPNNFGRFKVLKDKRFMFSNANIAGSPTAGDQIQSGQVKGFKFTHTFRPPLEVNFNATNGGTVADIVNESFHMIAGTNNANYAVQMSYYSRTCYKE